MAGRLVDLIDFREFIEGVQTNRRQRAAWWALIVGVVTALPAAGPKGRRTVEAVLQTIEDQWAPSIAMLVELGMFPLVDLVNNGRERLRAKHRAMMVQAEGGGGSGHGDEDGALWGG